MVSESWFKKLCFLIVDALWMYVRLRLLAWSEMACLVVLQFGQVGCGNSNDQNSPKLVMAIDNQVSYSSSEFVPT